MVEVVHAERRSTVLTPSSVACLAHLPTVNFTAGCAHQCRYCYTRGYQTHPGEGRVRFYTNTLTRLRAELQRNRKERLAIHAGNSRVIALPVQARRKILDRLRSVAGRHGLEVRVCACKNPDIRAGSCNISGRWPQAPTSPRQLGLFNG